MVQAEHNTVYDYGSNSVEQFDKVYERAGATTYPVVDIEPPYVYAPHYKDQQNQELRSATMRRSSAVAPVSTLATKNGGRLASPASSTVGRTG